MMDNTFSFTLFHNDKVMGAHDCSLFNEMLWKSVNENVLSIMCMCE